MPTVTYRTQHPIQRSMLWHFFNGLYELGVIA